MKRILFLMVVLAAITMFTSCQDHNDIVLKYGDAYLDDLRKAESIYKSIDSTLDAEYSVKDGEYFERALDNLDLYKCRLDASQFRYCYYTDDSFRELVDFALKEIGYYPYTGKFHTYIVNEKPPKRKYASFIQFDHQSTYFNKLGIGGI